jgi:hypothetical protein
MQMLLCVDPGPSQQASRMRAKNMESSGCVASQKCPDFLRWHIVAGFQMSKLRLGASLALITECEWRLSLWRGRIWEVETLEEGLLERAFGSGQGFGFCTPKLLDAPHMVIFPEEHVVLHSSLLQFHIQAAPVDRHNLADAAGPRCGM